MHRIFRQTELPTSEQAVSTLRDCTARTGQTCRAGLTVLELLTCVAAIGLVLGLLIPAVQRARESARRIVCVNNLKQTGLALHEFHDVHSRLPAGWRAQPDSHTAWGWSVELLPHLEQPSLQEEIHTETLIGNEHYSPVRQTTLPVFICPSDIGVRTFTLYPETEDDDEYYAKTAAGLNPTQPLALLPRSNYVGLFGSSNPDESFPGSGEGAFPGNRCVRWRDMTQGQSNVMLVSERTARKLPATWLGIDVRGEDGPGRVAGFARTHPNNDRSDECELDSRHPGGINVLFGDGRVQFISESIDTTVYQQMAQCDGTVNSVPALQ